MRQYLKVALTLFGICAVAAILLAAINQITAPYIAYNTQQTTIATLEAVSGGYEQGEQMEGTGDNISYVVPLLDTDGSIAGYILELTTSGYGGPIVLAASYRPDGSVISSKVMSDDETPGLGKNAEESWYMDLFAGLGGDRPLPESKNDLPDPSVVSGASVTFNGVSSAIRSGSEYVRSLGE